MAGGGGSPSTQSTDKSGKSSDALANEQMQAIANQKLADAQRAQYLLSSMPVQQYYTPKQAQQPAFVQSPTLRVPGFEGIRNPFVSAQSPIQAGIAPQDRAAQVANLLNQTNQYRQNYASQLYQAQQANNAQLAAMQKAYQDKMAADKAKAEAEAAAARRQELLAQQQQSYYDANYNGGWWFGAEGGIAQLMKGK